MNENRHFDTILLSVDSSNMHDMKMHEKEFILKVSVMYIERISKKLMLYWR
jgi:hypothetical protein